MKTLLLTIFATLALASLSQAAAPANDLFSKATRVTADFITYTHPSPGIAVPHMLTADEQPNPSRYLQPSTRDFVAVLAR